MVSARRLWAALLLVVVALAAAQVTAAPDRVSAASVAIAKAQATVASAEQAARRLGGPITTGLLVDRIEDAGTQARQAVATLAELLADPAVPAPRRAAIVARIGEGGRVAQAATSLVAKLQAQPSRQFDRTIATRTASPLGARFWRAAATAWPADLGRLGRFVAGEADAVERGATAGGVVVALLALAVAALLLIPVRSMLRRLGRRLADRGVEGRLRRSGWALWIAVVGTALAWLAAVVVAGGLEAADLLSRAWQTFASGMAGAVTIAAAVSAVAGALLQRREGSRRLLPVGDATAAVLRPWTIAAAFAIFVTVGADVLLGAVGLSGAARDVVNLAAVLLLSAVGVGLLAAVSRVRRRAVAAADRAATDTAGAAAGVRRGLVAAAIVGLAGWLAVATALVALAIGHIALALLVAGLLVWLPLVGASLAIAWLAIDDLTAEAVSGKGRLGRSLHRTLGVRPSVVDQAGVALSAALRLLLLLVAGVAAFAPFGSNLGELGALGGAVVRGVTIGEITIVPGAILRGIAVLALALFLVHRVERWLADSYLPTTDLDAGARNSISMIARYIGFFLAAAWALAAFGVGFQRIALVLSALSVGIGFGLQAITQNFVSGLILLIERPVKIGDLVEVGGQRGDVRRISVRATEIQAADRSTLVVPNSELITKTVRNLTLADALGVVSITFTVPLDTDVDAVRQLVTALFAATPTVLETPAPSALIASLDDGVVHFACTAYCESPRAIPATRSELLFGLIAGLRERGITIGSPPSTVLVPPAGAPPGSAGLIGDGG